MVVAAFSSFTPSKRFVTFTEMHCSTPLVVLVSVHQAMPRCWISISKARWRGFLADLENNQTTIEKKHSWESTLQFLHMVSGPRKMVERISVFWLSFGQFVHKYVLFAGTLPFSTVITQCCMDYLLTLGETCRHSRGSVGKYFLHGAFGYDI